MQRVRFQAARIGDVSLVESCALDELAELMVQMERAGAIPILQDGLAAGNCGILLSYANENTDTPHTHTPNTREAVVVSRSGKTPHQKMHVWRRDWVVVCGFSRDEWGAEFRTSSPPEHTHVPSSTTTTPCPPATTAPPTTTVQDTPVDPSTIKPTSDTPLLYCGLVDHRRYMWSKQPRVAVHGHALAKGEGLAYALSTNMPVSDHETLFSTPEDLTALEALFLSHPYPQTQLYIRKGHGFFILADTVRDAKRIFEEKIEPFLIEQRKRTGNIDGPMYDVE